MLVSGKLALRIPNEHLKSALDWVILTMGIVILVKEFLSL